MSAVPRLSIYDPEKVKHGRFHQLIGPNCTTVVTAYCQSVDQALTSSELALFMTLVEKIAVASSDMKVNLRRGLDEAV